MNKHVYLINYFEHHPMSPVRKIVLQSDTPQDPDRIRKVLEHREPAFRFVVTPLESQGIVQMVQGAYAYKEMADEVSRIVRKKDIETQKKLGQLKKRNDALKEICIKAHLRDLDKQPFHVIQANLIDLTDLITGAELPHPITAAMVALCNDFANQHTSLDAVAATVRQVFETAKSGQRLVEQEISDLTGT
jgi:hypothetical protein